MLAVNQEFTVAIGLYTRVAAGSEGRLRQLQEHLLVIFKKCGSRDAFLVVLALSIVFATTQQLAVESLHVGHGMQGDKKVATHVACLVLDVPFLMTGVEIAECVLEVIMLHETQEDLRYPQVLADASTYAASFIKDEARRDASDAMEYVLQAVGDAFRLLSTEDLYVAGIAVRKNNAEELVHPLLATSVVEVCFAEIHLCFSRLPIQLEHPFLVAVFS